MTPMLAKSYYVALWADARREPLEIKADDEAEAKSIVLAMCGEKDGKECVIEQDRRKFLGGSDIASMMNLQPKGWRTAVDLYFDKITPRAELPITPPEKLKIFNRGKRLEPHIVQMLQDEHGIKIVHRNRRFAHPEHDFMRAEIDFEWEVTADVKDRYEWAAPLTVGSIENGEIKSVHPYKQWEWGEAQTDQIPVHYEAQSQQGLGLTGRKMCLYGVLLGLDDLNLYPLKRDDEIITGIQKQAVDFWHKNVLAGVPPMPVNMDDMMRLFATANGRPVEATPEIAGLVQQYRTLADSLKASEKELADVESAICGYMLTAFGLPAEQPMTDDCVLTFEGRAIATWKKQRGAHLDQKRLKLERPEIVAAYMKETWFRVLRARK